MDDSAKHPLVFLIIGCVVMAAFGVLALTGWPGSGIILVPVGLALILVGGLQLALERLA